MNGKGRVVGKRIICTLIFLAVGCSKQENEEKVALPEGNLLELEERQSNHVNSKTNKLDVSTLSASDVIVSINGYPLTKRTYDDMMTMKAKGILSKQNVNQLVAQKILEEYRDEAIRNFIGQRLMIDNAFELKLVTTNDIREVVAKRISEAAKRTNKRPDQWLSSFKGDVKYLYYELATSYVMDKLITAKIPPVAEANELFVSNVQAQVEIENAAATRTNEMIRARLADWRRQIIGKRLNFSDVANAYSQDADPNGQTKDGVWGVFEESEMDDPKIAAAVFAIPENDISDVLEDENGFHLVKVLSVIPAEKNEKGRIVEREKRKLSHIYIEKLPLIIRQNDAEMTKDLQYQLQMQAINFYVGQLMTNGVNKVIYPHGIPHS